MGWFRHFLDDVEAKEIPLLGRKYTWSNERSSPTLVRLDRAFCCVDWEDIFPDDVLQSSSLEAVQQNWNAPVSSSCAVERLFLKLQRLSQDLQKWGQRKIGNVKLQLGIAKEILHHLEIARDSRDLSPSEEWLRKKLKLHCLGLASLERTIARLRSRVLYLKEGDANTSFFHRQARYRKKKNFIAKLQVGDQTVADQEDKQEAVLQFYENLLGTAEEREYTIDFAEIGI
ncbi:uncharacterized protein [Miscanthus floridulus]|uniref:uncharacterized protein n=1 Tax=Miscanthus floridulus TaxID=154761 RepID=UPI0034575A51